MSAASPENRHYLAVVNTARLRPDADPLEVAKFTAAADPFMGRVLGIDPTLKAFVDPRENDLGNGVFGVPEARTNLTVWETPNDLLRFLREAHQAVYSRYGELFAPLGQAAVALWWTPAEYTPNFAEAEERLTRLREVGPTEFAFDLATSARFPAPSVS